eukprot:1844375-Pleurochrysis_carterae.AAC.2
MAYLTSRTQRQLGQRAAACAPANVERASSLCWTCRFDHGVAFRLVPRVASNISARAAGCMPSGRGKIHLCALNLLA